MFSFWSNETALAPRPPPEPGKLPLLQRGIGRSLTRGHKVRPSGPYRCDVEVRSRDLWACFQHDPRDPAVAALRASDTDRNLVHNVLTDAFADGRLDREEYDERTAATLQARTLGQLPALVTDLVPDRPLLPAKVPLAAATSAEIQQRAEEKWRKERREAFFGFLGPTVICWVIWAAVMFGEFPWPLIPMAVTLLNFLRVATSRSEIVAGEVRRLEKRRAKELEAKDHKKQTDS